MARTSTSALSGLAKLAQERREMDARETQLRAQAAVEIGTQLLAAGAESIDLKQLEKIVRRTSELGPDEALRRLMAKAS